MPLYGIVTSWHDIPRQRLFYPSLFPCSLISGGYGAATGLLMCYFPPYLAVFAVCTPDGVVFEVVFGLFLFLFLRFARAWNACTHGTCFSNFTFLPRGRAEPPSHWAWLWGPLFWSILVLPHAGRSMSTVTTRSEQCASSGSMGNQSRTRYPP